MKAFAKLIFAAVLAPWSAAVMAVEQESDAQPSPTPAIITAVRECRAASGPDRVDEARLVAAGWAPVETADRSVRELRRGQISLVLWPRDAMCLVHATLRDEAQFQSVIEALSRIYGRTTGHQPNYAEWVEASGAGVYLDRSALRIRISIAPPPRHD